jgi:hypothetical protein
MKNTNAGSLTQKEAILRNADMHFVGGDRRADVAKLELMSARARAEANTLRLRALRLSKMDADQRATVATT